MNTTKVTTLEWVALAVITSIIAIYIIIQTNAPDLSLYIDTHEHINVVRLSTDSTHSTTDNANNDILNYGDNGDLVFFCGDTKGERTCRWFAGSMYSHVGMLFRETHPDTNEDVLYIWEADVGHSSKRGPRVMKFIDKLQRYHGYPYLMWRKLITASRPLVNDILKVVNEYKNHEFDDNMLTWWVSSFAALHSLIKSQNKVFCSELIALTMQSDHIRMMDKLHLPSYYSPGTFDQEVILGMKPNFRYSSRVFVDFSSIKSSGD